jgi:ABC-type phosphate transport system ATPase subunit
MLIPSRSSKTSLSHIIAEEPGVVLNRLVELAATTDFFEWPQQAQTAAFVRGELLY